VPALIETVPSRWTNISDIKASKRPRGKNPGTEAGYLISRDRGTFNVAGSYFAAEGGELV